MKKKTIILTLTIALLFTLSLSAQADLYRCKLCGSENVDSEWTKYTVKHYIGCVHGGPGEVDLVTETWYHVEDDCRSCGEFYTYEEYSGKRIDHIGVPIE